MNIPRLLGQAIVTFVIAAALVPLAVVLVPGEHDPRVGYFTVVVVFAVVFLVLRKVWPRPKS